MECRLKDETLDLDKLQDPGNRYELQDVIGEGVFAQVYVAVDSQSGGKKVAIKIQTVNKETFPDIEEEYRILRDLSDHPNLPDFYGAYLKRNADDGGDDKIWFVMQLCEGGPATDLTRALQHQTKKMSEIHIAFILKETIKALMFLHENHVIHRDVKGSNILLTSNGEVKLVDFGLSRELASTFGKKKTSLGTPCWMAPEVVTADTEYDNRADVWALGITAIELGDGKNPYEGINPSRVLFQIVRNPPPTLYRPASWSQNYNDFIAECLTKNPEYRPYMTELLEHPFFTQLPDNDFHLNSELRTILETVTKEVIEQRKPEVKIKCGLIKKSRGEVQEMRVEDLAALETINEDAILTELEKRHSSNQYYTFVGDVLLCLNPNQNLDIYGSKQHYKYKLKSRSDNAPHIFSVADSAYQDMLHHLAPQNIILAGESMSGKTTQFRYLLKHLTHLGQANNKIGEKIQKAVEVIQAFGNAATPINSDSTRHILYTQITFSKSGKSTGAIFWMHQLEKWRVTGNRCPQHANFHIFYYLYDGLADENKLADYHLESSTSFRYLRREIEEQDKDPKAPQGPREDPIGNPEKFKRIKSILTDLEIEKEQQETIWKSIAAVLLLGEVEFIVQDDGSAELKDASIVDKIAELLSVDSKKLSWALCNYCIIEKNTAARRKHSRPEAVEAKNVFARAIYARLVDSIVNSINHKFSYNRAIYGDPNCINILDLFGFECYPDNGIEQLFVNTFNEQLQYFYNQKIFISEMEEQKDEELPLQKLQFFNNKSTMDELMNKPVGVIYLLDEANKLHRDADFVLEMLKGKAENSHVRKSSDLDFSVAHYTGKVNYDVSLMCHKNRDFLPPELTEVMRFSQDPIIKSGFTNKLSRTGNVTMLVDHTAAPIPAGKNRWGAVLMAEPGTKTKRFNTASKGEFSQTKGIRTAAAVFRATSLELLRSLTTGGAHFVRCLRTDLNNTPGGFQGSIIRHQLRALAVVDTAKARRDGYAYRIPYEEFLRRYKFLAFDFDEEVEETVDNCRLLLVRLKLEGYCQGKTKIFLKYYNEEYLSRLYEIQVKKIVKVQSMLRTFLAKRNLASKQKRQSSTTELESVNKRNKPEISEETAAVIIQKHIKGYVARKKYGPLIKSSGKLDEVTAKFIRGYAYRWKVKSIFQVLLLYRASKYQELVYFSQQVHLYNQNVVGALQMNLKERVTLSRLKDEEDPVAFIGEMSPAVWKIPFSIKEFPYCDSSSLCGTFEENYTRKLIKEERPWDDPFSSLDKGCQTTVDEDDDFYYSKVNHQFSSFIGTPYCRDPEKADAVYQNQIYPEEERHKQFIRQGDRKEITVKKRAPSVTNASKMTPEMKNMPSQNSINGSNKVNKMGIQYETPTRNQNNSFSYMNNNKNNTNGELKYYNGNVKKSPERYMGNENNGENTDFRIKLRETGKLKSIYSDGNPIAEMEMKGKQMTKGSDEEPPFNFQAMLRKTNYNRASFRRNNEDNNAYEKTEDFTNNNAKNNNTQIKKTVANRNATNSSVKRQAPLPPGTKPSPMKSTSYNTPTTSYVNSNNANENSSKKILFRKDSIESIKLMMAATKDFTRDMSLNEDAETAEDGGIGNRFEEINTELLPGLIIVGHIAHV